MERFRRSITGRSMLDDWLRLRTLEIFAPIHKIPVSHSSFSIYPCGRKNHAINSLVIPVNKQAEEEGISSAEKWTALGDLIDASGQSLRGD
jgi:hypothetical protein